MTDEALHAEQAPKPEEASPVPSADKMPGPASMPGEEVGASAEASENSRTPSSDARRFLGGRRTLDARSTHLPRWFGLFVIVSATLICLIAFITVVSWPFVSLPEKPELICMVEADYLSPAVPFVRYGLQDWQLIRSLGKNTLDSVDVIERADTDYEGPITKHSLEHQLGQVKGKTSVIYIAAQGVSDEKDGYLLNRSSHFCEFDTGFSLANLLITVARNGTENVLLLLDTVRIDRSLQLGMVGNDFSYFLKRDFEKLKQEVEATKGLRLPNLCVICSADDGQISSAPPGLTASPFALTTAYALRGGPGSVTTKVVDSNFNGKITAKELAEFVERAVSDWSLEQEQFSQTPFHLQMGEDFPLVDVDRKVTLETVLAESAQSAGGSLGTATLGSGKTLPSKQGSPSSGETPTKETSAPKADPEKPTAVAASESSSETAPTSASQPPMAGTVEKKEVASVPVAPDVKQIVDRICQGWEQKREMEQMDIGSEKPLQCSRLKLALLRCEEALLANMPQKSQAILDDTIPNLIEELKSQPETTLPLDWSLAFSSLDTEDSRLSSGRTIVDEVIADPTEKRLADLRSSNLVEAGFIGVLAERFRTDGAWRDTELVKLAVATRTFAVPTSLYNKPYMLSFVIDQVETADRVRRRAEIDLITGRLELAQKGLRRAETLYREVASELDRFITQISQLEHMVAEVESLIEWLGAFPGWDVRKNHDLHLLNDFVLSIGTFCEAPGPATLAAATNAAEAIRERGIYSAEDSLQPVDWMNTRAVLNLTFIAPELRRQLLLDQYPGPGFEEFNIGFRQDVTSYRNRPANPFLLDAAFSILLTKTASPGLMDLLQKLSPIRDQGFESFADLQQHEAVRHDRAIVSRNIRDFINHLHAEPDAEFAEGIWWERWARLLMLSDYRASHYLKVDPRDVEMQELMDLAELDFMKWNVNRLYADSLELPGFCYANTIQSIAKSIRRLEPSYVPPAESGYFSLASRTTLAIPVGGEVIVPLRITALQDSPKDANPRLILQRSGLGSPLRFAVDGQEDTNGRVTCPLDPNLVAGQIQRVWLKVAAPADAKKVPTHAIAAMIECASGEVDWLPLHITIVSPTPKPAELAITWDDQEEQNGRIDLYPNQSLPLEISVVKHVSEPLNLRVEFVGQFTSESVEIATKAEEIGPVAIASPPEMTLSLDQTLTVRLYDGSELLDEREIDIAVLDLLRCFERQIYFDPEKEKVNVRITRIRSSDVDDPIPLQVQLWPTPALQGTLTGLMTGEQQSVNLDAVVPPAQGSDFGVQIGVAGVPRVFRDQIGLENLAGQPDTQLRLRVTEPQPDMKLLFSGTNTQFPVQAQVDGPSQIGYHIGFDWNHNGQLDSSEVQQGKTFWNGKSSRLKLVATAKPAGFRVESEVSDITLNLNTAGVMGQQTLLARAMAGNQTRTVAIPMYVLKHAPELQILQPTAGQLLGLDESIRVVVQTDWSLSAAVDNIEFAFDKNGNGLIDKGEAVTPVGFKAAQPVNFGNSHRLEVHLPTKGIEPGPMAVLARAITKFTEPLPSQKPVAATPPADPKKAAVAAPGRTIAVPGSTAQQDMVFTTTGTIEGQVVTADGIPRKKASVKLDNAGETVSDDQGRFTFHDVPAGSHEVTAATNQRSGTAKAVITPGQTVNLKIMIAVK